MTDLAARLPVVSVLIRSMNRPSLMEALDSLCRQHFTAFEVIVVNAAGVAHQPLPTLPFPAHLVEEEYPLSRAQAANRLLANCHTPYALFVDDDDVLDPDHIEALVLALEAAPQAPAAYSGVRLERNGKTVGAMDTPWREGELLVRNTLPIHGVLFRMASVAAANARFDTTFEVLEDWDFWLQLATQGDFLHLPGCRATYRLTYGHSGLSAQRNAALFTQAREQLYAKWLPSADPHVLGRVAARLNDLSEQQQWDIGQLRHDIDTLHQQLEASQQQLEALSNTFSEVLASRSMRLTAPLRQFGQWLRQRKRSLSSTPPAEGKQAHPHGPIDIIVPVYKGLEETRACLESVWAATPLYAYRLVVINDASPEPALTTWLREAAQHYPMVLLENEVNLGFVGTVNRGMAFAERADVVLLNSDAEVANDWLDRLITAAYQGGERPVSSVTPFSNNATICSYPRFCDDNELPNGYDLPAIDQLFAATNRGQTVDIPTAIGFCMYIRRDCLDDIGLFDEEHFGKGYGEENDFCMRAINAGWRHVHALDVFAWHKGSVSFGASQPERVQKALAVMDELHPDFQRRVHTFIQQDPAKQARMAVEIEQLHRSVRPCVLMLNHQRGGGTEQHCRELAATFPEVDWLILRPDTNGHLVLSRDIANGCFTLRYHATQDWEALDAMLRYLGVQRLHWHHWLGFDVRVRALADTLSVPQDATLHDFYSVCPQISMTNEQGRYCGELGLEQCRACLVSQPVNGANDIEQWRLEAGQWLATCERVIAPSADTAQRIQRYFPDLAITVSGHPDQLHQPFPTPSPLHLTGGRALRIAVLGALSTIKGADVFEQVVSEAAARQAPLTFKLFGYSYRALKPANNLSVTGPFEQQQLQRMLNEWQPDVVWFPTQCPETYSYTLSTCLALGLPVVAPGLGAFPERLANRPMSWLMPWNTSPSAWVEQFSALQRNGQLPRENTLPVYEPLSSDFYTQAYKAPLLQQAESLPSPSHTPLPANWEAYALTHEPSRTLRHNAVALLYRLREQAWLRPLARRIPPNLQRRLKSYVLGER